MLIDKPICGSADTVPVGTTVREAARIMKENGGSLILVLDGGRVAGILTEDDIVGAVAEGLDWEMTMVDDLMMSDSVCLLAESDREDYLYGERPSTTASVD
jgi:CBS domain-containing protein